MKDSLKKLLWRTGKYLLWGVLAALVVILAMSYFAIGGVKVYNVATGSMEPEIRVGSMVLVKSMKSYSVGDIITYGPTGKDTTTHRIFSMDNGDIITKGDANDSPDSAPVIGSQIVGEVILHLPLIGYLLGFTRTPLGAIILVIVPATIIIYTEVIKIKNEIALLAKKRSKRKSAKPIING